MWYNDRKAIIGKKSLSGGAPSRRKAAIGIFRSVQTLWYNSHSETVTFEELLAGVKPFAARAAPQFLWSVQTLWYNGRKGGHWGRIPSLRQK